MNLTKFNEVATMSSKEIAVVTGKNHFHVIRDIEKILDEAGIGASKFGGSYLSEQNKELPCYHLPKRETLLVVAKYSTPLRLIIIDRWMELEAKQAKSQSSFEWKQARLSGKQVRRSATDAIQQLVEYATAMGSKSATYYYSNITKMEYKALGFIQQVGIKDNLRDRLNLMQLNALAMAESVATAAIEQGLDEGLHYKDIYALAKLKVTEFADTISWMKLASPKQGKSLT